MGARSSACQAGITFNSTLKLDSVIENDSRKAKRDRDEQKDKTNKMNEVKAIK